MMSICVSGKSAISFVSLFFFLLYEYTRHILRQSDAGSLSKCVGLFPSGDLSEVTTVLQPESQRSRPPCVAHSLSLSDSAGRWKMVSINSSEQHGWLCREESWGRGNGSMQEERSA